MSKMEKLTKNCEICNEEFVGYKISKYCSQACNTKAYSLRHPDRVNSAKTKYRNNNKDSINKKRRDWWGNLSEEKKKADSEKYKEYEREYWRNRRKNDVSFKLKNTIRNRINSILSGKVSARTEELIGCTIGEFRSYLESKFINGMTWETHGKEWQIDHIIALALFDLSDPEQLKKACHYTNMQPLSMVDHKNKTILDLKKIKENES